MSDQFRHREHRANDRNDVDDESAEDQAEDPAQNITLDRFDPRLQAQLGFAQLAAQAGDLGLELGTQLGDLGLELGTQLGDLGLELGTQLGDLRSALPARSAPAAASCTAAITASACGSVKPDSCSLFATFSVSIAIPRRSNPNQSSKAGDGRDGKPLHGPKCPYKRRSCRVSFDDLVGAGEDRSWDLDADSTRHFVVDHQLEPGRLLRRRLARCRPLQHLFGQRG